MGSGQSSTEDSSRTSESKSRKNKHERREQKDVTTSQPTFDEHHFERENVRQSNPIKFDEIDLRTPDFFRSPIPMPPIPPKPESTSVSTDLKKVKEPPKKVAVEQGPMSTTEKACEDDAKKDVHEKPTGTPKVKVSTNRQPELKVFLRQELQNEQVIGEGAFGKVLKGNISTWTVAVKMFHAPLPVAKIQAQISRLTKLDHRNLVTVIGVIESGEIDCPQVVLQFFPLGNLLQFLADKDNPQDYAMLGKLSLDIVDGCEYLHRKNVIHANLAARNILVQKSISKNKTYHNAKVTDYGIARMTEGSGGNFMKVPNGKVVPIRWVPKELITDENSKDYNKQADVWSFGVLLWEMWTKGGVPYGISYSNLQVGQFILGGESPLTKQRPKGCPRHILDLMETILKVNPSERPTFTMLREAFNEFKNRGREKAIAGEAAASLQGPGNQDNRPPPQNMMMPPKQDESGASKSAPGGGGPKKAAPQQPQGSLNQTEPKHNKQAQKKSANPANPSGGISSQAPQTQHHTPTQGEAGRPQANWKQKNFRAKSGPYPKNYGPQTRQHKGAPRTQVFTNQNFGNQQNRSLIDLMDSSNPQMPGMIPPLLPHPIGAGDGLLGMGGNLPPAPPPYTLHPLPDHSLASSKTLRPVPTTLPASSSTHFDRSKHQGAAAGPVQGAGGTDIDCQIQQLEKQLQSLKTEKMSQEIKQKTAELADLLNRVSEYSASK